MPLPLLVCAPLSGQRSRPSASSAIPYANSLPPWRCQPSDTLLFAEISLSVGGRHIVFWSVCRLDYSAASGCSPISGYHVCTQPSK